MTPQTDSLRQLGDTVFGLGTVEALELFLQRSSIIKQLAESFRTGTLTEDELMGFACGIYDSLRRGEHLGDEIPLAACLYLLDQHPSRKAQAFVADFADHPRDEYPLASRFVRHLQQRRNTIFSVSTAGNQTPFFEKIRKSGEIPIVKIVGPQREPT